MSRILLEVYLLDWAGIALDGEGDNSVGNQFSYHYDLSHNSDWSYGYKFGYYDGYAAYDHQC